MEINEKTIRYYSPSLCEYVLDEKDKPEDCIAEKFTGYRNMYGIPIFEGDIVCRVVRWQDKIFEVYHVISYDADSKTTTACHCIDKKKGKEYQLFDSKVDLSSNPEWIKNEFVICNVHDFFFDYCIPREIWANGTLFEIESLVPDIMVCKKIMETNFRSFRSSIFAWSYNPLEGRWKLGFRSAIDVSRCSAILCAPTAEEIMKELPDEITEYDKKLMPEYVTEEDLKNNTGLFLNISKNCDDISSYYSLKLHGGGTLGLAYGNHCSEKLSIGLLGAWFFVQKNEERMDEIENSKK